MSDRAHVSHLLWSMWLNMFPSGMVWWVPGHAPKSVQPGLPLKGLSHKIERPRFTLAHLHTNRQRRGHVVQGHLSQDLTKAMCPITPVKRPYTVSVFRSTCHKTINWQCVQEHLQPTSQCVHGTPVTGPHCPCVHGTPVARSYTFNVSGDTQHTLGHKTWRGKCLHGHLPEDFTLSMCPGILATTTACCACVLTTSATVLNIPPRRRLSRPVLASTAIQG